MKKQSLLELAKSAKANAKYKNNVTQEDIDLVLAWVSGEVSMGQIRVVTKRKTMPSVYPYLANVLRQHILNQKTNTK